LFNTWKEIMDEITREPTVIRAEEINPRYNWGRALPIDGKWRKLNYSGR
jgi:hypothetical protein